jgi:hypothetical protein
MASHCIVQQLSVIPDGVIINLTGKTVRVSDPITKRYISFHPALAVDKETRDSCKITRCDIRQIPQSKPGQERRYYILPQLLAFDKKMIKRDDILTSNYRKVDGMAYGLFKVVGKCRTEKNNWMMMKFK